MIDPRLLAADLQPAAETIDRVRRELDAARGFARAWRSDRGVLLDALLLRVSEAEVAVIELCQELRNSTRDDFQP